MRFVQRYRAQTRIAVLHCVLFTKLFSPFLQRKLCIVTKRRALEMLQMLIGY